MEQFSTWHSVHAVHVQVPVTPTSLDRRSSQSTALKDEGIVIKALDSMWTTNDRSGSWLKIKLDYVRNMDIDAVIVGGWWVAECLGVEEAEGGGRTTPLHGREWEVAGRMHVSEQPRSAS